MQKIVTLLSSALPGVTGVTFSRLGGSSKGHFAGNNIGLSVGDEPESVTANRAAIKRTLGLSYLASAKQIHGERIILVDDIRQDGDVAECDAMITACPNVGLMIGHADCQAILLYDPVRRVIGAVHSGWRGSVVNIAAKTVAEMTRIFGTRAGDLYAGISPSLGPCCAEFVNYRREMPTSFQAFMVRENYFDFWQISRWQLTACGVLPQKISNPAICTSCSEEFFSYRRACRKTKGVTGRNGSVVALTEMEKDTTEILQGGTNAPAAR